MADTTEIVYPGLSTCRHVGLIHVFGVGGSEMQMEQNNDAITIRANASGRLWHEDPAGWERLCTLEGCPWCQGPGPPPDEILSETPTCWVTGGVEATVAGYVCISTKVHAVAPYELNDEDQQAFWLDAMTVARGLADAVQPVKMNYEIHGNMIRHVHLHLFRVRLTIRRSGT